MHLCFLFIPTNLLLNILSNIFFKNFLCIENYKIKFIVFNRANFFLNKNHTKKSIGIN